MIRIVFLIRSLNHGGAERQLALLVREMDRTRFAITVITFYDDGALRPDIEALDGVAVFSLGKRRRWDIPAPMWRLTQIMRRINPDIVHGYMNVANELSLLFGKPLGAKVVWGLRSSDLDFTHYDWLPRWSVRVGGWLSGIADLIIANSFAGKRDHAANGYSDKNFIVIPNGFDTLRFQPDRAAGQGMRKTWGVSDMTLLIGLVARIDPMKDHVTFLRGAAILAAERQNVKFVCVGGGPNSYGHALKALGDELGLETRLIWTGALTDMGAAQNALDIATSSSLFGEGSSNAIGEAMACGVPCVATDVGDSAVLIGSTGRIVPPGDPEALAAAWSDLLDMPVDERNALGRSARQRIVSEYSLSELARKTEEALARLVADAR